MLEMWFPKQSAERIEIVTQHNIKAHVKII